MPPKASAPPPVSGPVHAVLLKPRGPLIEGQLLVADALAIADLVDAGEARLATAGEIEAAGTMIFPPPVL